jgi:hypothetical protein
MKNIRCRIRVSLCALSLMAFVFAAAATAHAAVIYDNHAVPVTGGYSDSDPTRFNTGIYGAHTFSLLAGANTITGFAWRGFYDGGAAPPADTDLFTIEIYADSGGVPAISPLHAFVVGNAVNRTSLGFSLLGRPVHGYSASIAPLTLAPGSVYWLSIFNASGPGTADDFAWAMQSVGGTAAHRFGTGGPWTANAARLDFQILGEPVPEPTSVVLVGSGLLIAARRLRRRSRRV